MTLRRALLTGVSYLIPFVAVGGLLQALGRLLGGPAIADLAPALMQRSFLDAPVAGYTAAVLYTLGALAFTLIAPALAGYIAFALAGRPGLMPGFVTGLAASTVGAGFLGGLLGGVIAGGLTHALMPRTTAGTARALIGVPLVVTTVSGGLMLALLGRPIAVVTDALQANLTNLGGTSALLLGAILGAMIVVDLGGPVNKAAYTFAATTLTTGAHDLTLMAAVMAAGMSAPLALWLAVSVQPRRFDEQERQAAPTAGILGALFVTEGAIPYAATDPLRVLPSLVAGGTVAGATAMALNAGVDAPHGGVLAIFATQHVAWFILAVVAGTLTAATGVLLAKRTPAPEPEAEYGAEFDAAFDVTRAGA